MEPIRIAVVGLGVMGSNHTRVVYESEDARLVAVCDPDRSRASWIGDRYAVPWFTSWEDLPQVEAVILATPTHHHHRIAVSLIDRDVPLLVEKPLCTDLPNSVALVAHSSARGVPLACGFVERFNPAVTAARSVLDEPLVHLSTVRHSPATPRATASVVHDLLIHDIDLALLFMGRPVTDVRSLTWTDQDGVTEVAECVLGFGGDSIASLSGSRASHRKIRSLHLGTASKLIEVDLLRHDVTVYRHRSHKQVDADGPTYRAETVIDIPFVRHAGEPLALQLAHFVDLVRGHADPDAERSTLLEPHRVAHEVEIQAA